MSASSLSRGVRLSLLSRWRTRFDSRAAARADATIRNRRAPRASQRRMNWKKHLTEAATLIAAAVLCALVSNAVASHDRKVVMVGNYPNALKVPGEVVSAPVTPIASAPVTMTETTATTASAPTTTTPTPTTTTKAAATTTS